MLRNKYDYDILVLGGGTAGTRAALTLAGEGKRVAVCEPGEAGGYEAVSGYGLRAPLLEAAGLFAAIRSSGDIGIRGGSVGYNYPTLREWSRGARTPADAEKRLTQAGVALHAGTARFVGPHEISVGRSRLTAASFLIATGSAPIVPATISGLGDIAYLTPESAVDLLKPPKSIFIIGGGKTGVEFAGLFASFGSSVSIAEISPRLLPDEDSAAGEAVGRRLSDRGGSVLTSSRITSVVKDGTLHRITYLRGDVEHVVKAEAVLLAAGRAPALDLGLENADVDHTPLGVTVNGSLQTSAKHVYAAGSVTGNTRSAEGALLEADAAAGNLIHRDKVTAGLAAVPTVIFSQPQVARVGVNEADALRRDIAVKTATASFSDTPGHALQPLGSVSLMADSKNTLIGATVVGDGAAESINALATMVGVSMPVQIIARLPLAVGTVGEAVAQAARELIRN